MVGRRGACAMLDGFLGESADSPVRDYAKLAGVMAKAAGWSLRGCTNGRSCVMGRFTAAPLHTDGED